MVDVDFMKTLSSHTLFAFALSLPLAGPLCIAKDAPTVQPAKLEVAATADTQSTGSTEATVSPVSNQSKLPYGVEDVLKLSKARVNEDVILTYINNSGVVYDLAPKDIIYLRDQGVSDRVVNNMIDQKTFATQAIAQAPIAVPPQPAYEPVDAPAANYPQPAFEEPSPLSVAPDPAPVSSVYVIPYPERAAAYYSYNYPRYYPGYYSYGRSTCVRIGVGYRHHWHR